MRRASCITIGLACGCAAGDWSLEQDGAPVGVATVDPGDEDHDAAPPLHCDEPPPDRPLGSVGAPGDRLQFDGLALGVLDPRSVELADLDADGSVDLIVNIGAAPECPANARRLFNDGSGRRFLPRSGVDLGVDARFGIARFGREALPGFVTCRPDPYALHDALTVVLWPTPVDPQVCPNQGIAQTCPAEGVTLVDVDDDDSDDVVLVDRSRGSATWMPSDGEEAFGNPIPLPFARPLRSVLFADLDGDGVTDALSDAGEFARSSVASAVACALPFGPGVQLRAAPRAVGDAAASVFFLHATSGRVGVLAHAGSSPCGPATDVTVAGAVDFDLGDVDGDGVTDVVVATDQGLSILAFDDDDLVPVARVGAALGAMHGVRLADLDGTGGLEVVAIPDAGDAVMVAWSR